MRQCFAWQVLLTLSSAFCSYAENGWKPTQQNVWSYYYSNGKMAKEHLGQEYGDVLFWIEEDGAMATQVNRRTTSVYLDASRGNRVAGRR